MERTIDSQNFNSRTVFQFLLNWAAVLALLVCVLIFTTMLGKAFFSGPNLVNILRSMAITTIFAIAATVTMAPDGFDMSSCTLASFSAYIFVSMYLWYGMSLGMAIIVCILFTMVFYLVTLFLILVCKIPDMLATCALMFIHQGLGLWYTGGGAVSAGMSLPNGNPPARRGLSDAFMSIGQAPMIIIIMLACVAVAHVFLTYTKHGRYLYAMGGNRTAAKLSGINVTKYRFLAGMITAIFIAIGAIVVASRNTAA
ncbi:MAG: ABC transporter permease, partial [Sphaerochaetaceae bacterium]|nr:ABC transporter permease [Sphaerochaetaceae bacterium]